MKRRSFIRNTALTTGSIGLLGLSEFNALAMPGSNQQIWTRKDVNTLTNSSPEIVAYKKAINEMKKLPNDDPRSLTAQRDIHRRWCGRIHNNWHFLPWHRAYIYCFEEIIRELSGDESFALPYWNWTKYSKVPAMFFEQNSPLIHTRNITKDSSFKPDQITRYFKEASTNFDAQVLFKDFGGGDPIEPLVGKAESPGHNFVHTWVGGSMCCRETAAEDPLFWLHHCNIDRFWANWNDKLKRSNPVTQNWKDITYKNMFFDRKGKAIENFTIDRLNATKELKYYYDDQPRNTDADALIVAAFETNNALTFAKSNTMNLKATEKSKFEFVMEIPATFRQKLEEIKSGVKTKERTFLELQDIKNPQVSGIEVSVFLNFDNLKVKSSPQDPHYVGAITFFPQGNEGHTAGHGGHDENHVPMNVRFDITDKLATVLATSREPVEKVLRPQLIVQQEGAENVEIEIANFKVVTEKIF